MNRQTFQEYLQEPAKLYQLSLTELQGLVLDYPYSANLRLLLLLKARLEGHPRAELITGQVAARTFDRAYLYDLLRRLEAEAETESETLELKGLDEMEVELLPREESSPELIAETGTRSIEQGINQPPGISDPSDAPDEPLLTSPDESAELAPAAAGTPSSPSSPPSVPRPARSAQSRLDRIKQRQLARLQARLKGEDDSPEAQLRRIARRSVSRHRGVASETLAKLLVGQGQHQRALKMYEELSLAQPEKKAIFAAQIQELKEKL